MQLLKADEGCLRFYITLMEVYESDPVQKMEQHNKVVRFLLMHM